MPGKRNKGSTKTAAQAASATIGHATIHEATCLTDGGVKKGRVITQAQAESLRKNGLDVVVCGPQHRENMRLAKAIEQNANGRWKLCPPQAGQNSLPHCQPDPRPPAGHTFYETAKRHAL